jgi:hypothetical protein
MGNQKMMRTPQAVVEELASLSKQFGVDRKVLLNASLVILRCIMEKGAASMDIICEDGEAHNIPVPFVFSKENDE